MRQRDRDEFISIMGAEGVSAEVARKLLSAAATLHRLAELECSSEAADRDRVLCPKPRLKDWCLCRDYGAFEEVNGAEVHGDIPRIAIREWNTRKRVEVLCAKHGLWPLFGGDPRGAVLIIKVPSGRTNDWGKRGIVAG